MSKNTDYFYYNDCLRIMKTSPYLLSSNYFLDTTG